MWKEYSPTTYILTKKNINDQIPIETTILKCKGIDYLPDDICNLYNLEELNCNSFNFKNLPTIVKMSINDGLEDRPSFYNNFINKLPNDIGKLEKLRILYCNNCKLTNIPDSIINCNNLEVVDCCDNKLQTLPVFPDSLKSLWCNSNLLTSLPIECIPSSLEELHCCNNKLSILPDLTYFKKLYKLDCDFNNFSDEMNEIINDSPSAQYIIKKLDDKSYSCIIILLY